MKAIVADIYTFYTVNSRNTRFPKKFRNHHIIWDLRQALLELWKGEITELVLPKLGTPGYDLPEYIDNLIKSGQITKKPTIKYYEFEIIQKS